jgi:hypothetical protein
VFHRTDVLRDKGRNSNMSKVFVSMGMSLDGYVEGPNASMENMAATGGATSTRGSWSSAPSGRT